MRRHCIQGTWHTFCYIEDKHSDYAKIKINFVQFKWLTWAEYVIYVVTKQETRISVWLESVMDNWTTEWRTILRRILENRIVISIDRISSGRRYVTAFNGIQTTPFLIQPYRALAIITLWRNLLFWNTVHSQKFKKRDVSEDTSASAFEEAEPPSETSHFLI